MLLITYQYPDAMKLIVDETQPHTLIVCPELGHRDSLVDYTCYLRWAGQEWCLENDAREAALDTARWTNLSRLSCEGVFVPLLNGSNVEPEGLEIKKTLRQ